MKTFQTMAVMCTIYMLIFASFTNIIDGECEGCSGGGTQANHDCYQIKAPKVYACRGSFTDPGGLHSNQAKAICSSRYEICPSASRTAELGLTVQDCGNIPAKNKFFASLESSSGSRNCATSGTNDIWGCADMEPVSNSQDVLVYCDSTSCAGDDYAKCQNSLMAFLSGESLDPTDWSSGAWSFGSNTDEINTVKLNDYNYGGVLCCVIPTENPTSDPSKTPTISPTRYPTLFPTKTPTSNPSNTPTITPTKNPSKTTPTKATSISPTIHVNPSATPTKIPTVLPINTPTNTPTIDGKEAIDKDLTSTVFNQNRDFDYSVLDDIDNQYDVMFPYLVAVIAGGVLLLAIIGYIDSKYFRINDFFKIQSLFSALLQVLDLLSDIFLSLHISILIQEEQLFLVLFVLSVICIVVPIIVSIVQLWNQIKKHWWFDDNIKLWLTE
eukprot:125468_1